MNQDQIEKALESLKRFEDAGGRAALDKIKVVENSGLDIEHVQKQSRILAKPRIEPVVRQINMEQLATIIQTLRQPLPVEWVQTIQNINSLINTFGNRVIEIRDAVNNAAKAAEPFVEFLRRVGEANKKLESLRVQIKPDSPFGALLNNTINVYETNSASVVRQIEKQNLQKTHPALAFRLVQPSVNYVDFSQRTIERIAHSEVSDERAALGGSLVVAQEELIQTTNLIEEISTAPIQSGNEQYSSNDSTFNLFENIQLDLINVESLPAEATYPVLRRLSNAVSVASLVRQMTRMLLRCNQTAQLKGEPEIFKQTAQAMDAMVMLQGIVVRNESDLRDYVTFLYMLIYEGAGNQKLRFLKENGGCLEGTECDAIWNLKALRNKWLSHDPEHGKPGEIRASYRSLEAALKNLGFNRYPREVKEFEKLQLKITDDLLKFLKLIEDRLAEIIITKT